MRHGTTGWHVLGALVVGLVLATGTGGAVEAATVRKLTFISTVNRPINLPSLIGLRALRQDGIEVEVRELRESEAAVLAVAQGAGQFGTGFHAFFPAVERGAPVVALMELALPEFVLVTRREITDIRALHGMQVASHSARSTQKVLLDFLLARDYPAVVPEFVYMPAGSAARAEALLVGSVRAATMDLSFAGVVMRRAPGQFHILLDMTKLPVSSFYLIARRDVVEQQPQLVRLVIQRILESYRRGLADPTYWVRERGDFFKEMSPAELETQIREVIRVFDPNGGIDRLRGRGAIDNLQFQVDARNISGPVMKWKPGTFFSPEPLEAVLQQLGRR
ncbi:MAG: ABC transporter substrate-binding protein [Armatimonadota bacterium]|nr:ABC transporter substrate-binding protein [Armatimonadota bacterium]MDR7485666.1 ABC transporter substrate-binding protein [Armatimonadota bacterium]MDR7534297.1 ABC transporter substrate-binding protein [Armatimonadota bacterium]MDR7535909.1 ABC transporter substrate-binding protein [Armatimonadota bacterium]